MLFVNLLPKALALNVLNSQYLTNQCNGPPSVMYNFYTADLTVMETPVDEIWPFGYTTALILNNGPPLFYCGSIPCSYFPQNTLACFNPLNDGFLPYGSFSFLQIENIFADSFPPGTENAKYCHLTSQTNTSLFGMLETFVLADVGCIDDTYQCYSNGSLVIYSGKECTGIQEVFSLDSKPRPLNSLVCGEIQGELATISSNSFRYKYIWNAWVPGSLLVPRFSLAYEVFSAICFAIGFSILLYALGETIYRILKIPKYRKLFMYLQLAFYANQLLVITLGFFYWFLIMNATEYSIIFATLEAFDTFGSLLRVSLSTHIFLFEIHGFKTWQRILFISLLLSIHIGLTGASYMSYYVNVYQQGVTEIFYAWNPACIYWNIFVQIYLNVLPLLIMNQFIVVQYEKSTILQRFKILMEIDYWIIYCFIAQIALQIALAITINLGYGVTLGDDRIHAANTGPTHLMSAISAVLVVRIAHYIQVVSKHKGSSKKHSDTVESNVSKL